MVETALEEQHMNVIDPNTVPEVRATNGAQLPLRAPPLVFAIDNGDGTTENLWGVDIGQGRPVVYCGCRYPFDDGMWRDRRARTLRLNGRNETTYRPGYFYISTGGCLWLRWPTACAPHGSVPCYTVYPAPTYWRVRFSEQERARRARKFPEWREPHVLIQSGGDNAVAAVSILRLRIGATVRGIDGRPVWPIGVLPLDRRSSLHVVLETGARERVEKAQSLISGPEIDRNDWDEDDMEGLIVDMGSDEVGFATLIRMPVVLTS